MIVPTTNVVFDLGKVLLEWDPRHLYRKIFADEAEMEWFLRHVCNHDWNIEQDKGRSFAEAVAAASASYPRYTEQIAAYDRRWHETLPHAIEASVAILGELSAKGRRLFAITNFSGEKFRETKPRFAFLGHFRDIVVSGDVRMIKPDPAIYRLLLDRNELRAQDCLFIDDNLDNVRGAEAAGMGGHHFRSPEGLREALVEAGLL